MKPNIVLKLDYDLIFLRAYAEEMGHIKLAVWGKREDLIEFAKNGNDRFEVLNKGGVDPVWEE